MQEKFTRQAVNALKLARSTVQSCKHTYIGTEHILVGLLKEKEGTAGRILEEFGVEQERLQEKAARIRAELPSYQAAEERQMELALRASEALLQFNPEDPYEIRDRGLIYAQLDCDHVALLDLSYFVEQCPEDPISEMIRAQINTISHKQITLH